MSGQSQTDDRLDVLSFGEALVDFLPERRGRLRDVETFRKVVGGAPANLAVGLGRLGRRAALMTKVGDDEFGRYLRQALEADGVDCQAVRPTREAKTGITFVSLDASGDRSFLFFREPSADLTVRPSDVDEATVARSRIFQLGSNLLTEPGPRQATHHALALAGEHGCIVTYDPNVRLHLWPEGPEAARRHALSVCQHAHLVKVNDEELAFLGEGRDAAALFCEVMAPAGVVALVVTHGAGGAEVYCGQTHATVDAPPVDVVDTTGAGDGFMAGLLTALCEQALDPDPTLDAAGIGAALEAWSAEDWQRVLALGCRVGSTVCQSLGATPGLPRRDELE